MHFFVAIALLAGATANAPAMAADTDQSAPMKSMGFFAGDWVCNGSFPASGKKIASVMRFDNDLQGDALLKHHTDKAPATYRAIEAWAWDRRATRFNAIILDNSGGARRFSSAGWAGDTLSWDSAPEVQPEQRFVYTRLDARSYRLDWQKSKNGNIVVGDTLTCERP